MNPADSKVHLPIFSGRGSQQNPANPYDLFQRMDILEDFEGGEEGESASIGRKSIPTEFYFDHTKSIVSENDSPDIGFQYSINPYRGCEHGCSYCYARRTHEYLGWGAGIDFESRILVKSDAAGLLRDWLCRPTWSGERIVMSGVTDPYQPIERRLRVTRSILEVLIEAKQCVSIITKNALIERDIDLLSELANENLTSVAISLTTLNTETARKLEPRCSSPTARLRAISSLHQSGIAVHLSLAPVIPGLNDHEMPAILKSAAEAGASTASMTMLRLPGSVKPVFLDWLEREMPEAKERVLSRISSVRGGQLNQSAFGNRMRGDGVLAENIHQTFRIMRSRYGLEIKLKPLTTTHFRPPKSKHGQLRLF